VKSTGVTESPQNPEQSQRLAKADQRENRQIEERQLGDPTGNTHQA
jgi:hypothetical protein